MKWNFGWSFFLGVALFFYSYLAHAYDEPTVNLGYTSFLDGGPPSGKGWYFMNYFQYYATDRLTDNKGKKLPFPRTDLYAIANIFQLIYLSSQKLLGANLAVSAVWPWLAHIHVDDGLHNTMLNGQKGLSDLFIGPALQYDPIMRKDGKGPLFVQRFEFDVVAPVGRYNPNIAVNPATPFWSLNPYWAATLWITPKWSLAYRLHYLWNAKNNHPAAVFGPQVYSTQAGQAVFANVAMALEVTEKFQIGINGYFFYQFTDTRVNDVNKPDRREKVWAIGPGMLYSLTKNQFLFFNTYSEQGARNRPQGANFILRYVIHF